MYLRKYKSELVEVFKEFRQEVEKQLGKSIKIFRLDRSGEYLSLEFQGYLRDNGIVTMNQTLLDMVRFMMSLAILPKSFLGLCTGNYCLCDKQNSIRFG